MKLSPDLHDADLDGSDLPGFDADDAYGELGADSAYFPEPANETDGSGALELVTTATSSGEARAARHASG
jgi:hypothetical protein